LLLDKNAFKELVFDFHSELFTVNSGDSVIDKRNITTVSVLGLFDYID